MTSTITGTPSSQPNKYLLIAILLWLTGACRIGDPTHVLPGSIPTVWSRTHERVRLRQRKDRNFNATCQRAMY
ncbi:MAG: hypothetical protein LC776_03685, partial [Acidobacteria bacterium]|nr:hypothetical protein [Acidobacteriota bacterium]